jgi:hypothetical protein
MSCVLSLRLITDPRHRPYTSFSAPADTVLDRAAAIIAGMVYEFSSVHGLWALLSSGSVLLI